MKIYLEVQLRHSGDDMQTPSPIKIELDSEDVSFDAQAPVKGQGRMDAAWGSSQGDEVNTAQVAPSKETTGFIFEQV